MKVIIFRMLFILYSFCFVFILGCCIGFPFMIQDENFPKWTGFILYPIGLLIASTQEDVNNFFNKKT